MCRKAHGAAFGTYASVEPGDFRWMEGEELVTAYESSPGERRLFCRVCGSSLGGVGSSDLRLVTLGTVDGDPGTRPEAHIFAASRAPWHEITDELPQYEEWSPE